MFSGKEVDVSLKLDGNKIYQTISQYNNDIKFSIVTTLNTGTAQTFLEYFSDGHWQYRSEGISLSVYPRSHIVKNYLRTLTWNTVKNYFGDELDWSNTTGMEEQYYCHFDTIGVLKSPWNLGPWRKAVGSIQTVNKLCNP